MFSIIYSLCLIYFCFNLVYLIVVREKLEKGLNNNDKSMKRTTLSRKQKWEETQLYTYFKRQTNKIYMGTRFEILKIEKDSDLTDKIKCSFFQAAVVSMHYLGAN